MEVCSRRSASLAASLLLCGVVGSACVPIAAEVDLVLELVSAPMSAQPGSDLEVVTRVCNRGTALWSGPTEVEHFIHEFPTPASPDGPFAGLRPVPPLAPGECDEQSHLAPIPSDLPHGVYQVFGTVDPYQNSGDTKPGNNDRRSWLIGIGHAPDLVVRGVTGAPSAYPGSGFDARVDVCNQGTEWSGPTDVMVYLSEDAVIESVYHDPSSPDWPAGPIPVPDLAPGLCITVEGPVTASFSPGAFHLGAIVDENDTLLELIEINNRRAGGLIGVGDGPDLVVSELTGPLSSMNWTDFDVHAVVCNQGTTPSFPSDLSLYFSEDAVITPSMTFPMSGDPLLMMVPTPPLEPGQCHGEDVTVHASAPAEGAWFLGAVIDEHELVPELIESNNTLAGDLMGVGYGPDLVVRTLASAPSVELTGTLDVDAEVCNLGTDFSGPSELRLYFSADLVLEGTDPGGPPGADPELGLFAVPILAPGECWSETVLANSSVPEEGAYHLAGSVDELDYVPELIESNNVLFGPQVGVGWKPDLVVTDLTAPPSARIFDTFEATATVCNQGTAASPSAWLAFYHSEDQTISGEMMGPDHFAGNMDVPFLDPGACVLVFASLAGSVMTDGAYYLGAIVDEYENVVELIETNNTFTGPLMGLGEGADLVVERLDGPPTAEPGETIWVDLEVCNQGTLPSVSTDLHLYASPDASIEGLLEGPLDVDHLLGPVMVPPLMEGECHVAQEPAALPPTEEGLFTLGAIVDEFDSVPELVEANNTYTGDPIGVGFGPDLIVTRLVGPPSADEAIPFPVEVEICNQGNRQNSSSTVSIYLSEDTEVDGSYYAPGDPTLADLPVPMLDPGACHTEPFDAYAAVPQPGAWYLAAIVDEGEYVPELVETNNTFVGPLMGIGSGMDLVISSITAPPSVMGGTSFPVDVEVCNQGTSMSSATLVVLYHSQDTQITGDFESPMPPTDFGAAGIPVPSLMPGECVPLSGTAMAAVPFDGAWYLGGIVDELDDLPELIESNNKAVGPLMGVGGMPDLVITQLDGPASVPWNGFFQVTVEVCNQGQAWTTFMTQLVLYHTTDTVISGMYSSPFPDATLGYLDVPSIGPSECYAAPVDAWGSTPGPQTGYLAAIVDEMDATPELIETNNEQLGAPLEITPAP